MEKLHDLFYGDTILMKNYRVLYDKAKEAKLSVSRRQVEAWYKNQAVQQIFRPLPKITTLPITSYEIGERVYADTMFISDFVIICIIDNFSKFGHAKAFKVSTTSAKALETFKEFEALLKHPIKEVRTDGGTEFMKDFTDYLKDKKTTTLPYAKGESGIVERFNYTVRLSLEKLKTVRGQPVNWVFQYLPLVLKSYNDTKHERTNQKPIDIINDLSIRSQVQRKLKADMYNLLPPERFRPGDAVRKYIRDISNPFDKKKGPNWSWELYTIKKIDRQNNRVQLEDHTGASSWVKPYYLQKVDTTALMKGPPQVQRAIKNTMKKLPRALAEIQDYLQAPEAPRSLRSHARVAVE